MVEGCGGVFPASLLHISLFLQHLLLYCYHFNPTIKFVHIRPKFGLKQLRTFFKASHAETGSYGVAFHTSASSFRGYLRLLNVMGTLKSLCVDAYNTFSQWATRQLCSFFNSLAGIVERRLLLLKQ